MASHSRPGREKHNSSLTRKALLKPLMDKVDELEIKYTGYFGQLDSYLEHFNTMFAPTQIGMY